MSNRMVAIVGSIVVPLLLALCAAMLSVISEVTDNSAQAAANSQRNAQQDAAQMAYADSLARIEGQVTQIRVDQAHFVGGAQARIRALEGRNGGSP